VTKSALPAGFGMINPKVAIPAKRVMRSCAEIPEYEPTEATEYALDLV
jgi:hypothetical protein